MSDKLPKIKNCPFCGRPGKTSNFPIAKGTPYAWSVACKRVSCNSEGPSAETEIKAIKKWNNRPTEKRKAAKAVLSSGEDE